MIDTSNIPVTICNNRIEKLETKIRTIRKNLDYIKREVTNTQAQIRVAFELEVRVLLKQKELRLKKKYNALIDDLRTAIENKKLLEKLVIIKREARGYHTRDERVFCTRESGLTDI